MLSKIIWEIDTNQTFNNTGLSPISKVIIPNITKRNSNVPSGVGNLENVLHKIIIEFDQIIGLITINFGMLCDSNAINPTLNNEKFEFVLNGGVCSISINASTIPELKQQIRLGSDNIYRLYLDILQPNQSELFVPEIVLMPGASITGFRYGGIYSK